VAEEIQEAVQIIRVAYEGIEIAMKVGSGGISALQKAIHVLAGLLEYEKSIGKTNLRKLLMKGGDLQVFQFPSSEKKQVERLAKKYGILYSSLPDVNKEDGMSEIVFHSEAVPRINMMIQKLKEGRIATFEDYVMNGKEEELGKLTSYLKNQKAELNLDENRILEYQEMAERAETISKAQDVQLEDITINKSLIAKETDTEIKMRIPGTWGEDVRFLWVSKEQAMDIHDGKTILTFLDQNRTYDIYDKDDRVVDMLSGKELYNKHYDRVEKAVRERFEKSQKQEIIPKVSKKRKK
jgi:hypothetical protein